MEPDICGTGATRLRLPVSLPLFQSSVSSSSSSSGFSEECCGDSEDEEICGEEDVSECAKFHMENFRKLLELDSLNKLEVHTVRRLGPLSCKPWNPHDLVGTGIVR